MDEIDEIKKIDIIASYVENLVAENLLSIL